MRGFQRCSAILSLACICKVVSIGGSRRQLKAKHNPLKNFEGWFVLPKFFLNILLHQEKNGPYTIMTDLISVMTKCF